MSSRFRLGVVGTGQITTARHLPAALSTPGVEVTALVDTDERRAAQVVEQLQLNATTASRVDDVLDRVDGLVIATPNHTHRLVAMPAIRAGTPVLIEKPLAATSAEGRLIVEAAESAGSLVAVGYATRFDPRMQLLKALFDSGYFGRVSRFAYQLGMADWGAPVSGYTFRAEAAGGGVLIVNGSHFLDRLLWWFGSPSEIDYQDDSEGGPECRAELRLTYTVGSDEMTGRVWITKDMRLASGFVAETDAGILVAPDDASAPMVLRPKDRPSMETWIQTRSDERSSQPDVFRLQLENFVSASRGLDELLVDGREGLRSLELIEACYARRQPLQVGAGHFAATAE